MIRGQPDQLSGRARLLVSWRAARPAAAQYRVTIVSQGSHRLLITRRDAVLVWRDVSRHGRVLVSVVALNATGELGPRVRVQLRLARRKAKRLHWTEQRCSVCSQCHRSVVWSAPLALNIG